MEETKTDRKSMSRRNFLKSTGAAVAVAAASGMVGAKTAEAATKIPKKWDKEADIIMVGSGYSGLAGTLEARRLGLSVLVLEKMKTPGGNSIIADGGANAVDPVRQKRQGIVDSTDLHFKHTMEGGDNINDPEKVRYMVEHALDDCVNYLENLGVKWPDKVVRGYGSLYERTHYIGTYTDKKGRKWQKGAANIYAMLDEMEKIGHSILLDHEVTQIIREKPLSGRVLGVEIKAGKKKLYFRAKKGVVLASGGFGANLEWVIQHDRRLEHTGTTNHPGATGECIKFAEDVGADTLHMDYIQAIPLKDVIPPFKGMFFLIESEEVRKASPSMPYRIFANKDGKRFVDEGARRDVIKATCLAQPLFEPKNLIEANTIEELEDKLGIPKGNLVETVNKYNAACDAKSDPEFGKDKSVLIPLRMPPFIARTRALQRHHTMGGLLVKGTTGEVIDRWGNIIPGLYSAGRGDRRNPRVEPPGSQWNR